MSETAPDTGAAGDLGVLLPDVELEVRDPDTGEPVELTVREYRFRESLAAKVKAQPLFDAMAALPGDDGSIPDAQFFAGVLEEHAELWIALIARACGKEPAWIARLAAVDGERLGVAMWQANGSFFTRGVVTATVRRRRETPSS